MIARRIIKTLGAAVITPHKLLLGLAFLTIQSIASAEPIVQRLRYEYATTKPWSMTLRTLVVGENERLIAVEIIVSHQRCIGAFSGLGSTDGRRIFVRPYKPATSEEKCLLTIELDATGKVATLSESNCSYYHGAECDFEGTLFAK